jgi:hypothetical protein
MKGIQAIKAREEYENGILADWVIVVLEDGKEERITGTEWSSEGPDFPYVERMEDGSSIYHPKEIILSKELTKKITAFFHELKPL